jgi:hypothetical protein
MIRNSIYTKFAPTAATQEKNPASENPNLFEVVSVGWESIKVDRKSLSLHCGSRRWECVATKKTGPGGHAGSIGWESIESRRNVWRWRELVVRGGREVIVEVLKVLEAGRRGE